MTENHFYLCKKMTLYQSTHIQKAIIISIPLTNYVLENSEVLPLNLPIKSAPITFGTPENI